MPLLERGELLERERVDLAEQREGALGGAHPLLLLAAHVGIGLGLGRLGVDLVARGRGRGRHEDVGAVLLGERLGVDPEVLHRLGLERLDPQPLLGAGHLVAVDRRGERLELGLQLAGAGAQREELALAHRPRLLGGVAFVRRHRQRDLEPRERRVGPGVHGGRDGGGPRPRLATLGRPGPRGALGDGRALELLGPAGEGAHPLLARADREPCLDLGLTGQHRRPRRAGRARRPTARPRPVPPARRPAGRSGRRGWPGRRRAPRSPTRSPRRCARPRPPRPGPRSRAGRAVRRRRPSGRPTRAAGTGRGRPAAAPRRSPPRRCRARTAPARSGARRW